MWEQLNRVCGAVVLVTNHMPRPTHGLLMSMKATVRTPLAGCGARRLGQVRSLFFQGLHHPGSFGANVLWAAAHDSGAMG